MPTHDPAPPGPPPSPASTHAPVSRREPRRVAFFVTCLTETFYPRAGIASVLVLEHLGCTVTFPEAQTCCGQPMFNNGLHDESRRIAARMLDVFDGFDYVVTPSGSCAAMVHEQFPRLFESDAPQLARARNLAARTFEFTQFLLDVLHADLAALGVRWDGHAAHYPSCHLRAIGMHSRSAAPLTQIDGLRLSRLDHAEQCCGFGGAFSIKFPDVSTSLVKDKVDAFARSGASTFVCNDAGCAMNIEGACRREKQPVRMITTPEIIAEGLGLLPREPRS